MGKIKVIVIDDSFFMRKLLSDILNSDSKIEVVATAKDGKIGLERIKELKPDVVTLDYLMPGWNGLTTLKMIMKEQPTAVVMVSTHTKKDAPITLECLKNGAIDYVLKPSGSISWDIEQVKEELLKRVKAAAEVDLKKLEALLKNKAKALVFKPRVLVREKVVAIGASTGGPAVLELILKALPKNMPSAILIVQHMSKVFTKSFAERLDRACQVKVKEAEDGEAVIPGTVYIAPGGQHMAVERKQIKEEINPVRNQRFLNGVKAIINLSKNPPVNEARPSVDVLMESVAEVYGENAIGIILTGMGSDGVEGLGVIGKAGGETIAQDENSSLIFGMPKRAIEKNVVDEILPSGRIAGRILRLLTR